MTDIQQKHTAVLEAIAAAEQQVAIGTAASERIQEIGRAYDRLQQEIDEIDG